MKPLCALLVVLVLYVNSFASGPNIKAIGNDVWSSNLTWDGKRLPQDNDTITIPANITVRVDKNAKLNHVTIKIYGVLNFVNGSMDLDINSHVIIQSGGRINGSKSSEYIKIGGVVKYTGTNLVVGGYSFADATSGNSFLQGNFLPVTLIAFYATLSGDNVLLQWTTAQEFNDNRFEIERSADGRSWIHVAELLSEGNNSMGAKYTYTDRNIPGTQAYYRIMQIDGTNHFQYSNVKKVVLGDVQQPATIYASSKQSIAIDFNSEMKSSVSVNVMNLNGQIIARGQFPESSYTVRMNLPGYLRGMYVIQVTDNNGM